MQPQLSDNWLSEEPIGRTSRVTPASSILNSHQHEAYVWQVHGKPVSIHLNLDVVEGLQFDLFQSTGNEVAGVLLGHVDESRFPVTVTVEGYELASGVGTPLAQQQQLAEIVGKWNAVGGQRRAVGLIRSQPRGWLALGHEDIETGKCFFPQCDNIFLVVRSTPGAEPRAGFFFWEGNHIRANESYSEFVFDSEVLRRQLGNRVHVLNAEAEVLSEKPVRSFGAFGRSIRKSWLAIGATWCLALACTMTCVHALEPDLIPGSAAAAAPAPTRFKVDYHGHAIEVNLNHGLPSETEREDGTLSDRQKQLLRYFAQDIPPQEIASKLGITPEAVEVHKQVLSQKLHVTGEAGLVRYAIKAGLVEP